MPAIGTAAVVGSTASTVHCCFGNQVLPYRASCGVNCLASDLSEEQEQIVEALKMGNFKKINGNFVTTSAQVAQDKRLSWKAKGIYGYICSLENYPFKITEAVKNSPQGKKALQSGLKELEKYGYIKREKTYKLTEKHFDAFI